MYLALWLLFYIGRSSICWTRVIVLRAIISYICHAICRQHKIPYFGTKTCTTSKVFNIRCLYYSYSYDVTAYFYGHAVLEEPQYAGAQAFDLQRQSLDYMMMKSTIPYEVHMRIDILWTSISWIFAATRYSLLKMNDIHNVWHNPFQKIWQTIVALLIF